MNRMDYRNESHAFGELEAVREGVGWACGVVAHLAHGTFEGDFDEDRRWDVYRQLDRVSGVLQIAEERLSNASCYLSTRHQGEPC